MADFDDEVFALPISGHYDIGYSYGAPEQQQGQLPYKPVQSQPLPIRTRDSRYDCVDKSLQRYARSSSPPTVLPISFTAPRQGSFSTLPQIPEYGIRQDRLAEEFQAQTDLGTTPTFYAPPPPVPPKSWARTNPGSPRRTDLHQGHGSESDLSVLSMRSRQQSAQSVDTTQSSSSSCSIEPDQLPAHSHPEWLSATQSVAFSGPRSAQPVRLCRKEVVDLYSGEAIFQLSDETKLKLSRQAIYQIHEFGSTAIIGTLGFSIDAADDVAAILRGQDVVFRRESPSSSRWCFTPSNATKKSGPWFWMKDRQRGDIILADNKKGSGIIARIQRDVLSYERGGLGRDIVDEICISAMALAELARRNPMYEDCTSLAAAIAVVALGDNVSDEDVHLAAKPKRKLTLSLR